MRFFTYNEWNFTEENVDVMWKSLNKEEKKLYPFNQTDIDYTTLIEHFCIGLKLYFGKEKLENNHKAEKRHRM